jgi:hypothetical protein
LVSGLHRGFWEERRAPRVCGGPKGPHSGENLAEILLATLEELEIAPKLLTITGDNVGNNETLCDFLHTELLK